MTTQLAEIQAVMAAPPVRDTVLLEHVAALADPATRLDASRALARLLSAEHLLVFTRDPETKAMLTASGLPQTLPDGRGWRTFLAICTAEGECHARLPLERKDELLPAVGFAAGADVVLVLLGAETRNENVSAVIALLPLLAALFRAEQHIVEADSKVALARDTAQRTTTLAATLDLARIQLQSALDSAREARASSEQANEQLRQQATQLEAQAMELEIQAEELHASNQELEAAREAADTANRAKSEFLATMSHELRTPLNAISGHVQLMELEIHGPLTPEQRAALERVQTSQRHLLGLINDILNLARIEAGHVEYSIADLSLADVLAEISPMIEPQVGMGGLRLEVSDLASLPSVRADRHKLQQILLNLLSNAVKFTARGGSVRVDGMVALDDPGKVRVSITDTGRGIPIDKVSSIFEPFVQVDSGHTPRAQGTGLGLSISRDLARGMGGEITVESTLGVGSVFTLTLPRAGTAD